ncbi:beta-ketoacyl-ACP synthase [Geminocystis sp. GBBB08]|uniref:beta-ketoacyl-ACP synthase n=1 Tax=Geminocystis sp. GBBB08 TaxID=2604140 RepID=UPI0027E25C87|nr:beta-ketoacyl-ACP synthase [Geminocystis sp. GBBB08]MBL1210191.1 beta-ketoacyl-ACP synthase [Geminocystis sp. GBBB08]
MVKVVVTGISLISCLGDKNATWRGIIEGISGIKFSQPFDFFPPLPLGLINSLPSSVSNLTTQLIEEVCLDGNIFPPLNDTAVVIGSSRGCQSQWEVFLSLLSSQKIETISLFSPDWLQTLPHQPAIITANYLQTSASVFSPANACATGLVAIAKGYELIKQQKCERVIVGAVETPITPLTIAGFTQMKALSYQGCYPFATIRDGFVLGEGGAMLILETEELARSRDAKIYGEILSWGMSCDADTMTSPEMGGKTAMKTIRKCLYRGGLQPKEIDYIHAHGTGTILNDQREAKIINELFCHAPKISSTKGATGHTLGASGAMATALSLMSLKKQILLPNISSSPLNFDLNFCQKSSNYSLNKMLCFSFGFGGQNIILAMGK